jgi:hypothetical protein
VFTLSRQLRTLTLVWVVSLTDWELTPQPGLPTVYSESRFGV